MSDTSDLFDITIIGGGVIGLSIANQLSKRNLKILLLEKEKNVGLINSSRNTEVIHAGIYYQHNSLKAKLSLRGKSLLYAFCQKYNISNKKTGKLIIQSDLSRKSDDQLEKIFKLGTNNGVSDLRYVDSNYIKNKEPNLYKCNGIFSPSSGVVDSNSLIKTLEALSLDNKVLISNNSFISHADLNKKIWLLSINNDETFKIKTRIVINSAGLNSLELSNKFFQNKTIIAKPVKGSYLRYSGKSPFNSIIYPAFSPGLINERVDASPDIWGGMRFGPSVEETKSLKDFNTSPSLINRLYPQIKKYFPLVKKEKLSLDISGIRPKIMLHNNQNTDFIFDTKMNSWIDLFGIESPGLTATLAIAEYVEEKVNKIL